MVAFFGGPPIIPDVVIVDCEGSGEVEFSTIRSRKRSRDLFYILVRPNGGGMTRTFVTIKTFPDEQSARLAQAVLAANGIEATISADTAGGMEPQLQYVRGARLLIREAVAAVAARLLNPA